MGPQPLAPTKISYLLVRNYTLCFVHAFMWTLWKLGNMDSGQSGYPGGVVVGLAGPVVQRTLLWIPVALCRHLAIVEVQQVVRRHICQGWREEKERREDLSGRSRQRSSVFTDMQSWNRECVLCNQGCAQWRRRRMPSPKLSSHNVCPLFIKQIKSQVAHCSW